MFYLPISLDIANYLYIVVIIMAIGNFAYE